MMYEINSNFPCYFLFLFCFKIGIKKDWSAKPSAKAAAKSMKRGSVGGSSFLPCGAFASDQIKKMQYPKIETIPTEKNFP